MCQTLVRKPHPGWNGIFYLFIYAALDARRVRPSNLSSTIKFSPRLGLKSGHTARVTPTNYCIYGRAGSKVTVEEGKEVGLMAGHALFVMLAVFGREGEKTGKPSGIVFKDSFKQNDLMLQVNGMD